MLFRTNRPFDVVRDDEHVADGLAVACCHGSLDEAEVEVVGDRDSLHCFLGVVYSPLGVRWGAIYTEYTSMHIAPHEGYYYRQIVRYVQTKNRSVRQFGCTHVETLSS